MNWDRQESMLRANFCEQVFSGEPHWIIPSSPFISQD